MVLLATDSFSSGREAETKGNTMKLIIVLLAAAVLAGCATTEAVTTTTTIPTTTTTIPGADLGDCSGDLTEAIIEIIKEEYELGNSPALILKIYDPEEESRTANKLVCTGNALLSNGKSQDIVYCIDKDEDGDFFRGIGPDICRIPLRRN